MKCIVSFLSFYKVMKTLLYIEERNKEGKPKGWFRLHKYNWKRAPHGILRIARYDDMYCLTENKGYEASIHMRYFVRLWKRVTKQNREERKILVSKMAVAKQCFLVDDVVDYIMSFV